MQDVIELRRGLERWTQENCGFEERNYLGMNAIWRCPAGLYDDLVTGRKPPGGRGARMFYEGLLHERDMLERLQGLGVYGAAPRLVAEWDERLQGRPDGELWVDGKVWLLEIKSVTMTRFEEVKRRKEALQRDYEQVQLYMLHGDYTETMVIYKARQTGELWPIKVYPHERTQRRLENKARAVLAAVDAGKRPECECGKHGG